MHYLTVLSFMILFIRVLIFSFQVLFIRCYILFMVNNISKIISMHTMHPSSISIIFFGGTLALVIFLLVFQPMSLQNTTCMHMIPYQWSHSYCRAHHVHSTRLATVRWLVFAHRMVQQFTVLWNTLYRCTSYCTLQFQQNRADCGPQKWWVSL